MKWDPAARYKWSKAQWEAWWEHAQLSLAEGLCPYCRQAVIAFTGELRWRPGAPAETEARHCCACNEQFLDLFPEKHGYRDPGAHRWVPGSIDSPNAWIEPPPEISCSPPGSTCPCRIRIYWFSPEPVTD